VPLNTLCIDFALSRSELLMLLKAVGPSLTKAVFYLIDSEVEYFSCLLSSIKRLNLHFVNEVILPPEKMVEIAVNLGSKCKNIKDLSVAIRSGDAYSCQRRSCYFSRHTNKKIVSVTIEGEEQAAKFVKKEIIFDFYVSFTQQEICTSYFVLDTEIVYEEKRDLKLL